MDIMQQENIFVFHLQGKKWVKDKMVILRSLDDDGGL